MLPIQKMISKYNNSSRGGQRIKYLVFHYTGNKGDTAENNARYFNGGNRGASAHYFVSDNQIYQVVEDYRAAWSVGDGDGKYGITNSNTLNVEMCCWSDGTVSEKTEKNALELGKYLMKKHGISIENVVRHYDASRKICPNWSANNWARWIEFKEKLQEKQVETPSTTSYTVKITADVLNVRAGIGTNYKVNTQVRKGEVYTIVGESNGWGKLKSGAGWISLKYTSKNGESISANKPTQTIKIGSRVKITGSKYATGQSIPSWVKDSVYTVQQIKGDRALIKEITSWVYTKDLKLV